LIEVYIALALTFSISCFAGFARPGHSLSAVVAWAPVLILFFVGLAREPGPPAFAWGVIGGVSLVCVGLILRLLLGRAPVDEPKW
jgi:multisubunit Na+/H+ antiporter MnhB subunit